MTMQDSLKIIFNIINDLASSHAGVARGEIASKYGISPGTANKYLHIIEEMGIPIYDSQQRWNIDEDYFVAFTLTAEESEFLLIALERSLTSHTSQWQTVRSLFNKLSNKMSMSLAGELQSQFESDRGNLQTAQWFTMLTQAKQRRIEAWVTYQALNRPEATQWLIRPFRFMSNPLSDGFYVLCEATQDEKNYISLSLKFDRIFNVILTNNHFEVIDQARFRSHYGQAWGVWNSTNDPVRVVLRFEPRHYDRLIESNWHPSQDIRQHNDGYVSYIVNISDPEEMIPWIRSWGSGVIVEEPLILRQRIIRSLQRQIQNYGLSLNEHSDEESLLHLLWAKYDRKSGATHLLIYHLLDVGSVAWMMWDHVLSERQKNWLCILLQLDADSTRRLIALLVGIHDIGKATPGFQNKAQPLYERLIEAGLGEHPYDKPHGIFSAVILYQWFEKHDLKPKFASQLASVIGGHHGSWISDPESNAAKGAIGKEKWQALQVELCELVKDTLGVERLQLPDNHQQVNLFATFLSGFVSVCDWIGSNEIHFPYESTIVDTDQYFQRSLLQAETALREFGWLGWTPDGHESEFFSVFNFQTNGLQQTAIEIFKRIQRPPRLILVEYLTGGGKTELALYLADLLMNIHKFAGVYVAMPTQATSNQMFERVGNYLQSRYSGETINLQLIHSQSEHHSLYQQIQPQPNRDGNDNGLTAELWFQNRKRSLLAPYAVGTIDQAMLSVLQVRHHFVRQFGLSQKVVIFDEIHSYDTYMNTIIERLLGWLVALDSPMILLSATLSKQNRHEILNAVNASVDTVQEIEYPRLTVVEHDGSVQTHALPKPETRLIYIEKIQPELDSLCEYLKPIYEQGGCIAIICNTVNESIEVARYLRDVDTINEEDVWLFHARFPPVWRNTIELDVLESFGKTGDRPVRAILVATQIIEQSLDLDFDLMITRPAPIDLLIQRVGRLHRHDRLRPSHLDKPTLIIRTPPIQTDNVPDFGVDEVIYGAFFLLKSWLLLRNMDDLRIPEDIDLVMDYVYSNEIPDNISETYATALQTALEDMTLGNRRSQYSGSQYVIGKPDDRQLIGRYDASLSDDENLNIATRDILPGVDLICIVDSNLQALTQRKPSRNDITTLLRYKVSIRHKKAKQALDQLPLHSHWERVPQLRYSRVIRFDNGIFDIPDSPYYLRLTLLYGLEILLKEDA